MRTFASASVVTAALCCGCAGEHGAKMAATGTGDLTHSLSDRASPTARLQELCSVRQASPSEQDGIDRAPYLQRVSATSAWLLFTTTEVGGEYVLELRAPGAGVRQSVRAERDPADVTGRQLLAHFNDLEPDTVYCYELVGSGRAAGFRTAPAPAADAPVRFVAFGDSGGGGAAQHAVRDQLHTVSFDLMLHTGDIAYGDATLERYEQTFFAEYAELLASVPVFPTSGNHDYAVDRAAPFRQIFALPDNGGAGGMERWYSFDWGAVHFVALDTELLRDEQVAWLDGDLSQNVLPWKIVYLHRPPYSSGTHGSSERVREAFAPTFARHGVQLVLAGHDHDYERTRAIDGVTYVITGGGGHGTRPVGRRSFTAHSEDVLHFIQGEVLADSLLLHAIDATGREFDSVRIERDR